MNRAPSCRDHADGCGKIALIVECLFRQICEVIHSIRRGRESFEELCEQIYLNTRKLFFR